MEFDYVATDEEVREAYWLYFWNIPRKLFLSALALVFISDFYLLLDGVRAAQSGGEDIAHALRSDNLEGSAWLLVLIVVVCFLFLVVSPWLAVRRYRKFPGSAEVHHATVTSEELEIRVRTAGLSRFRWEQYKFWREGKRVIIVAVRSGPYQTLPTSGLSEDQCIEFRNILTAALPKKK
jgi:hypothetical protein